MHPHLMVRRISSLGTKEKEFVGLVGRKSPSKFHLILEILMRSEESGCRVSHGQTPRHSDFGRFPPFRAEKRKSRGFDKTLLLLFLQREIDSFLGIFPVLLLFLLDEFLLRSRIRMSPFPFVVSETRQDE